MDHHVKILNIIIDNEISAREVPFFRGSVNSCINENDVLFHNHMDNQGYRYSYPLIQYKRLGGKAAIVSIGEGVNSVVKFFSSLPDKMDIGRRTIDIRKITVLPSMQDISLIEDKYEYELKSWLPLKEENYQRFNKLENLVDKLEFLEKILCGNILSFCKGLDIYLESVLDISIIDIEGPYEVDNKGVKLMAFNASFTANINLPDNVGLGKNSSIGFGVIKKKIIIT